VTWEELFGLRASREEEPATAVANDHAAGSVKEPTAMGLGTCHALDDPIIEIDMVHVLVAASRHD
jgi:hypothetical protein